MSPFRLSAAPGIHRTALVTLVATLTLGIGAVATIIKNTPTGPTAGVTVLDYKTSSGTNIFNCDELGNCTFGGTITASGGINVGGSFVLRSGDTMTGALIIDTASPGLDLLVRGTMSGYALAVSNLINCDTIDTDASGNMTCGTDMGVGAEFVRISGDTMTGGLVITGATLSLSDGTGTGTIDFVNEFLQIETSGGGIPELVIGTGGNIGVGTTTPTQKLSVSGGTVLVENPNLTEVGTLTTLGATLGGAFDVVIQDKYAYVTAFDDDSLTIIDISDPTNLNEVGFIQDNSQGGDATVLNGIERLIVAGKYAYVASAFDNSLSIFDISDPTNPIEVGTLVNGFGATQFDGAFDVYVTGKFAYVTSFRDFSLTIVDISDPTNPIEVSTIVDDTGDGLGTATGTQLRGTVGVYVQGNYAYVISNQDDSLTVIDISRTASPVEVGVIRDNSVGGVATQLNEPRDIHVSGKHAYITAVTDDSVSIFDISDPTSPTEVGTIVNGVGATALNSPRGIEVAGKFAYVTAGISDSVSIIDISDETNPVEVSTIIDNNLGGVATQLNGALAVALSGKHAFVAAIDDDALSAIEIGGIDSPTASFGDLAVSLLDVTDNANIANDLYVGNGGFIGRGLQVFGESAMTSTVSGTTTLVLQGSGTIVLEGLGTMSGYSLVVSDLNNCDTIDTNAFGLLSCDKSVVLRNPDLVERGTLTSAAPATLSGATRVYVSDNYAYVTSREDDSLTIIDITEPTNPVEVGTVQDDSVGGSGTTLDGIFGIAVVGKYAYTSVQTDDAFVVIDVSDASNPVEVGIVIPGAATYNSPANVYVSGKHAYVTADLSSSLTVFDISDPTNPIDVAVIRNTAGATNLFGAQGVYVQGKFAYVASSRDDALTVIDISDPVNPVEAGFIVDNSQGGTATQLDGASQVYVSGRYAYVASVVDDSLSIFDISDPTAITEVDTIVNGVGATELDGPQGVVVSGKFAYVTGSVDDSVSILDVSDPANITEVTTIKNAVGATQLNNPFGIDISGKFAYVASIDDDSLSIFEIGGIDSPTASIGDLYVSTLDVSDDLDVANSLYVGNGMNIGGGGLQVFGPEAIRVSGTGTTALTIRGSGAFVPAAEVFGPVHIDGLTGSGELFIDGDQGGKLCFRDTDNAGFTRCDALNGVLTCVIETNLCP